MPKKHRLSRADLARTRRAPARRARGEYFTLAVTALPAGSSAKVACIVSKKIAKRAPDRNTIERRAREALRPLITHIRAPLALVFTAIRGAREASYAEIERDITKLLDKVR